MFNFFMSVRELARFCVLIDIQVKGIMIALQKTQFKQENILYMQNYTDISFCIFTEDLELYLVHADVKEV